MVVYTLDNSLNLNLAAFIKWINKKLIVTFITLMSLNELSICFSFPSIFFIEFYYFWSWFRVSIMPLQEWNEIFKKNFLMFSECWVFSTIMHDWQQRGTRMDSIRSNKSWAHTENWLWILFLPLTIYLLGNLSHFIYPLWSSGLPHFLPKEMVGKRELRKMLPEHK